MNVTTPKDKILPGTFVRVTQRKRPTNMGQMILSTSGFMVGTGNFGVTDGTVLEILFKPKKTPDGVRYVVVSEPQTGKTFWAYYVHIRYDTTPI